MNRRAFLSGLLSTSAAVSLGAVVAPLAASAGVTVYKDCRITGATLSHGRIIAVQISAGSITAERIPVGSISAHRFVLGSDGHLQEPA